MKLILVLGALLWLLLSWFSNSVGLKAEEITTDNLISQDFTDGSWNNPVNSWHSSNDLAGWNGLEHTTEVTHTPETDALKENGFNMTAGGEIFHWYNGQKVHVTQSVTLDNGTVFEQTKTYEASRGTVHDVANTIVISSNTSASYDLGMGILFEDNRGLDGHRSADFRDPYITLTYDDTIFQLETPIEEIKLVVAPVFEFKEEIIVATPMPEMAIITNDPVVEEIKDEKPEIVETFVEEIYNEEPKEEVKAEAEFVEEVIETKTESASDTIRQEFTEVTEEVTKEEPKEVAQKETKEEIKKEEKTDVSKEEKAPVKQEAKQETLQAEKEIKTETKTKVLTAKLDSVDVNVKDVSKNLELKNLIKLDAMLKDEMSLDTYTSVAFYKPLNIYSNQDLMKDTRLLYSDNTLDVYIQNDPVVVKQKNLSRIKYEKRKLMLQIQDLKNG
tara:strand:- start:115 stop:1446 length:1332 start_codon:yes stop_codon:yes gene_type:complete